MARTTLADNEASGLNLHIMCRCGNVSYRSVKAMRATCQIKGISEVVDDLAGKLKCERCGSRNPSVTGTTAMQSPYGSRAPELLGNQ